MADDNSFLHLVNVSDINKNNIEGDINSNNIVLVNKTLYQTVPPNYLQQVLYKVQALNLPVFPIDTCYIGKPT